MCQWDPLLQARSGGILQTGGFPYRNGWTITIVPTFKGRKVSAILAFLDRWSMTVYMGAAVIAFIGWALASSVSDRTIRAIGLILLVIPGGVFLFQLGRLVIRGIARGLSSIGR